jgi:hypothetical protein
VRKGFNDSGQQRNNHQSSHPELYEHLHD